MSTPVTDRMAVARSFSNAQRRTEKIAALVESAPPLTDAQRARITSLLAAVPRLPERGEVTA